MPTYQLTLNEKQLQFVNHALELYFRIGLGQLQELPQAYGVMRLKDEDFTYPLIEELRQAMTGFSAGESLGIHSKDLPDRFKVVYDVYQVIRYLRAWEARPKGGIGVDFDQPYAASTQPLPTLERIKDGQNPDASTP